LISVSKMISPRVETEKTPVHPVGIFMMLSVSSSTGDRSGSPLCRT